MEDIAVTIFRVIIIAILIIGAIRRDKRKRMAGKGAAGSGNRPAETPWESQPRRNASPASAPAADRGVPAPASVPSPAAEPQRQTRQQVLCKSGVPTAQRVEYVEVDPDEAEAMAAEYYRKRNVSAPQNARTSAAPAEEAAKPASVSATERDEEGIAGRFNLRDAVLYSEILKPKFDE